MTKAMTEAQQTEPTEPASVATLVERLTRLYAHLGTTSKNYDGEAVADAITALSRIEQLEREREDAEHLRRILRAVRPYISDRAGAGIIDAVNVALTSESRDAT